MDSNTFGSKGLSGVDSRTKDLEIVEIVKGFLKSALIFADVEKRYQQETLKFSNVEKLVETTRSSPLFDLKEAV